VFNLIFVYFITSVLPHGYSPTYETGGAEEKLRKTRKEDKGRRRVFPSSRVAFKFDLHHFKLLSLQLPFLPSFLFPFQNGQGASLYQGSKRTTTSSASATQGFYFSRRRGKLEGREEGRRSSGRSEAGA